MILREFAHLSESDLMVEIYDAVREFAILTKSEEIAVKILEKYGKRVYFDFNDYKKVKYFKLMICAELMNLFIPESWYDVCITDDDVIKRIIELRNDEIKWLNDHSYIYDSLSFNDYDTYVQENSESVVLPSDIKIDEIIAFYNGIIGKEFGSGKKLVRD